LCGTVDHSGMGMGGIVTRRVKHPLTSMIGSNLHYGLRSGYA
ncbi:MAG: hypothetical protein ACD_62C00082G0001, partial [uncultured bacterium]